MPSISLQISPLGPLIDVQIGVSAPREAALKAAGQSVPNHIVARLLIDTGASGTSIDISIPPALGLTPSGLTSVHTPSTGNTPVLKNQFDVRLTIPHPGINRNFLAIPVIESDLLTSQGIHGLLGRDILSFCVLIYNGDTGLYTLSF
jgi:hypothetical protein